MKKFLLMLIMITATIYGEGLPQLNAVVGERNSRIEIKIMKIDNPKIKISKSIKSQAERKVIRHKVKKGETLSEIAKMYRVSVFQINKENTGIQDIIKKLQNSNKQIKNIDLIYAGDTLIITR